MIVFVESEFGLIDRYQLWVMSEYGVVESWTKIIVQVAGVDNFFGCTDCGELLFDIGAEVISYDPESLNKNKLGIFIGLDTGLGCTTDLLESLVLLDQHNEAEIEVIEPDSPLSLKENPRETNPSLDACPFRLKYPSLPSWEVQVTNDSGEVESMIIPRSKHVPYMPLTGGKIEVDFVECHYLIESMKNWIWSSSQSSFDRQNKLSHEIELLRNKVESQASNIRTLERCLCSLGPREVGRSSDPVTDAAGVITPPADEEDPMKTTMQSKEDFSQHMKCLALQDPSHYQLCESTTMAASRSKSKSGHLSSSQQITFNDYDKEEKKYIEPLVQRQGKRGRL
ncbi:uncharacterized protein LOC126712698 [Quercus robur]|uniref:uncharacterized protein LOC126712698 n=1 Tax=Quercus robur TaxID=38942 RepID=UPI002163CE4A|nr:uncharacterized protein LOC126712698 [Quercus robur]